jgi:acyl-CoA synthetase (AMP-forming)/AMP-acid ligase II
MGLIGCLLQAVYQSGSLVLIPPELFLARPALWLRAIARHRATISVAPSFAYALCASRVKDEDLAGADLSSWRLALCGAEPVSLDSLDHFARRFAPFGFDPKALRPVYGLAEASLAVTFTPGGREVRAVGVDPVRLAATGEAVDGARAIVSVGTPVPGTDVEVRGASGKVLGERRVGRIFVRGPSVMVGYFNQPEATARTLAGGWLDTGDLGFVAGGELHVCGREKNVIVIRGANHLPQEFEECLAAVEGVRAGCAVAVGFVPEGEDGEQLLVMAERARGGHGDDGRMADGIRRAVLAHSGIRPHTVLVLEPGTIPRTSSGKLRRNEALRRFLAGELGPPAGALRPRLVLEVFLSVLAFARARLRARVRRAA